MKISVGTDHAGFKLKDFLIEHIKNIKDIEVELKDNGCFSNTVNVDYTNYCKPVVDDILHNKYEFGLLICNTGIGMSILANRFSGIRAGLCFNTQMAYLTRAHNNANILCLGQIYLDNNNQYNNASDILDTFLTTKFTYEERYIKRIDDLNLIGENK